MIKPVIQEPHSTLRKKAQAVSNFGNPKLAELVEDMKDTLIQQEGLGLAAPQIDVSLAVFVIPPEMAPEVRVWYMPWTFFQPLRPTVFFNPRILGYSQKKETEDEGCLSIRGFFTETPRAQKVTLEAQNEKGQKLRIGASGLLARLFQHETDHLNGVLFIDHLHG